MSLLPPPRELVRELSNGDLVCYDHGLERCGRCCVDFSFMQDEIGALSMDSENEEEPDDEKQDESSSSNAITYREHFREDQVFILGGCMARFLPQWDEQVLGPGNTFALKKNYERPPKPLPVSALELSPCSTCHLIWLVGEVGKAAAADHPSHHTYTHEYAGSNRSLIVYADGACLMNGTSAARAAIGVHFGQQSKFNISELFNLSGQHSNQRAELHAVARALEVVRTHVLPERRRHTERAKGGHDKRAVRDTMHLRLIITTDSSYVVEGMCSHIQKWTVGSNGQFVNERKEIIKNSDGFLRIQSAVEHLSHVGVQVAYYHVRREENGYADRLANAAFHLSGNP